MRHADVIPVPPACRERFADSAPSRRDQIRGTRKMARSQALGYSVRDTKPERPEHNSYS
jgi:hypothetical protein